MEEIKVKVEIFFISHEDKGERIILVNGEEIYRDSQKYWLRGKEKSVFREFLRIGLMSYVHPKNLIMDVALLIRLVSVEAFSRYFGPSSLERASSSSPNLLRLAFRISSWTAKPPLLKKS